MFLNGSKVVDDVVDGLVGMSGGFGSTHLNGVLGHLEVDVLVPDTNVHRYPILESFGGLTNYTSSEVTVGKRDDGTGDTTHR